MDVTFCMEQQSKKYFFYYPHSNKSTKWRLVPLEYPFGHFLITFLSIDFDSLFDSLIKTVEETNFNFFSTHIPDITKVREIIEKLCNDTVLSVLISNVIFNSGNLNDINAQGKLLSHIIRISPTAKKSYRSFQEEAHSFALNRKIERDGYIDSLPSHQKMGVSFQFYSDSNTDFYAEYHTSDLFSLLILDIINIQSNHIVIKQCENCGKLFIPNKRSDEIYCDRIYKNGKTCKQIGYSMKEQSDPFKREFAKARKTQHARIRYNRHIKDYKEKHYLPWLNAAQEAKKKYEATNDITGFCDWLEKNKNAF